ncbi:MAG: methionyl-tRNA formyltransferase, partial [Symploca sp. SIO1C4]|nr:methionyl-tRNA formyltransferase [Symploca sp. SIO1C4]
AGMDTGAMLLKAYTPVNLLDNAQKLAQTLSQVGADLLVQTLLKLQAQEITAVPQNESQATYAPLIQKSDYHLDWSHSNLELHNQVRGFFPNCVALFRDKPLKIIATAPLATACFPQLPPELKVLEQQCYSLAENKGLPGEVMSVIKGIGPIIQTGEGLLLLREVQLAGKRPQSGWDFANGMRLAAGEVLGNNHD